MQGPEIPTTGTLPGHCSGIWESAEGWVNWAMARGTILGKGGNGGKWGEMGADVSFLEK